MRVLYLDTSIAYGGGQESLRNLILGLRGRGVEPLVQVAEGSEFAPDLARLEIPARTWSLRSRRCKGRPFRLGSIGDLLRARSELARVVRSFRPTILHANGERAALAVLLSRWRKGRPPLLFHDRTLEERRGLVRWLGRRSDMVLAVSRAVAAKHSACPKPVRTVPDGIDLARFTPLASRKGRPPVFAYVGRRSWEKGPHIFAAAAIRLRERGVAAEFAMTVDRPSRKEAARDPRGEGTIRRASDAGAVDCLGFQDDVAGFLERVDVLVLPSLREGLGIAAIEALARCRPVIAARVGGLPEIVQDGVNGILVEPGSVQGLVSGIVSLVENPSRRLSMGREGPASAERFSLARMRESVLGAYHELLERMHEAGGTPIGSDEGGGGS